MAGLSQYQHVFFLISCQPLALFASMVEVRGEGRITYCLKDKFTQILEKKEMSEQMTCKNMVTGMQIDAGTPTGPNSLLKQS